MEAIFRRIFPFKSRCKVATKLSCLGPNRISNPAGTMKLRNLRTAFFQVGLLFASITIALGVRAQSITLYSDFYATQYGVAVTSLTQGQIVNISEGGIWSTNGFNQTYTIDLSDYGEDTLSLIHI